MLNFLNAILDCNYKMKKQCGIMFRQGELEAVGRKLTHQTLKRKVALTARTKSPG